MTEETVVTVPEVPASRVVVTSENRTDFMNKKLDIQSVKPEPEKTEAVTEAEPEAKAEPETKAEQKPEEKQEQKKEKTHPIKERMGELANARKEAEAKATAAEERAAKAEREAAELRAKLNPPKPETEVSTEPQRAQFNDENEYLKALVDHRVEVKESEREKARQDALAKAESDKSIASWKERVAEMQKEVPDYAEKINAATVMVSEEVRDAIIDSEVGPRILLHLAEKPEDAERIGKLTIRRALKEIGKLEAQYTPKAEAKPEPKAEAKPAGTVEISKAPAPISPLKGASAAVESTVDSNGVFHGTYAQWKAQRKAGKIK